MSASGAPTPLSNVLLLGPADAGKTTLIIQMHGRLDASVGVLRSRASPTTLEPISAGLARLQQGLPVEHTPKGTSLHLDLLAETEEGDPLDITLPDYAGEDLESVMRNRRVPAAWRDLARSADRWLLLMRLSKQVHLPDVISKPIGVLAARAAVDDAPIDELPDDMWAVELLQVLSYVCGPRRPARRTHPGLALVLSCWDELQLREGIIPADVAAKRLAVLDSYCRTTWTSEAYNVFGLSAQGRTLDKGESNEDFLDAGPQSMGWLILPDGRRCSDLTRLACP